MNFRALEQRWWQVDRKRIYTDQRVAKLSVLAEVAAFASGFQMVMVYELELPALEEFEHSHVLLAIWGVACITVTTATVCVVFLAIFITLDLLNDSAREHPWSLIEDEMLSPPGCPAPGTPEHVFVFAQPPLGSAEEVHERWCKKHERRVLRLLAVFNYSAPVFMCNIGLSSVAKFYMAPPAGWTAVGISLMGVLVWWRLHNPKVQNLIWSTGSCTHTQCTHTDTGRHRHTHLPSAPLRHSHYSDSAMSPATASPELRHLPAHTPHTHASTHTHSHTHLPSAPLGQPQYAQTASPEVRPLRAPGESAGSFRAGEGGGGVEGGGERHTAAAPLFVPLHRGEDEMDERASEGDRDKT